MPPRLVLAVVLIGLSILIGFGRYAIGAELPVPRLHIHKPVTVATPPAVAAPPAGPTFNERWSPVPPPTR